MKKNINLFVILSGVVVGTLIFSLIYGLGALNVFSDTWIMRGYVERDILQHYAGWCAFRNDIWRFPLGYTDKLTDGVYITFTDSIPLLAIVFKAIFKIIGYTGTFQYFGLYGWLCFVLQAIAMGYLVHRKTNNKLFILGSMLAICLSPILIERNFRHTALASQYLILFAMYFYLKGREEYGGYPIAFTVLSVIAITVHPYYIPMVLIFAFMYTAEAVFKRKNVIKNIVGICISVSVSLVVGYIIGAIGSGVSASRTGFGFFSMNLNAIINPTSSGGYVWSKVFKVRPQILGNYDGFNYLGIGYMALIVAAIIVFIVQKKISKAFIKKNVLYICCMIAFFVFAISNVVTLDDKEIIHINLPTIIEQICGIYRSSARFFYVIFYSAIVFSVYCISGLKIHKDPKKNRIVLSSLILIVIILQIFDLSTVIKIKHEEMDSKMKQASLLNDNELSERLCLYSNITSMERDFDVFVLAAKNNVNVLDVVANSGNFESAIQYVNDKWQNLRNGNHSDETAFVTKDREYAESLVFFNKYMELYELDGRFFLLPSEEEYNNNIVWQVSKEQNEDWINGVSIDDSRLIKFEYEDDLFDEICFSTTVTSKYGKANIEELIVDDEGIKVRIDSDGAWFAYPNLIQLD